MGEGSFATHLHRSQCSVRLALKPRALNKVQAFIPVINIADPELNHGFSAIVGPGYPPIAKDIFKGLVDHTAARAT
jgi:hypothetical protein